MRWARPAASPLANDSRTHRASAQPAATATVRAAAAPVTSGLSRRPAAVSRSRSTRSLHQPTDSWPVSTAAADQQAAERAASRGRRERGDQRGDGGRGFGVAGPQQPGGGRQRPTGRRRGRGPSGPRSGRRFGRPAAVGTPLMLGRSEGRVSPTAGGGSRRWPAGCGRPRPRAAAAPTGGRRDGRTTRARQRPQGPDRRREHGTPDDRSVQLEVFDRNCSYAGAMTRIAAVHGVLPPYRYEQHEITDALAAMGLVREAGARGARPAARRLHGPQPPSGHAAGAVRGAGRLRPGQRPLHRGRAGAGRAGGGRGAGRRRGCAPRTSTWSSPPP